MQQFFTLTVSSLEWELWSDLHSKTLHLRHGTFIISHLVKFMLCFFFLYWMQVEKPLCINKKPKIFICFCNRQNIYKPCSATILDLCFCLFGMKRKTWASVIYLAPLPWNLNTWKLNTNLFDELWQEGAIPRASPSYGFDLALGRSVLGCALCHGMTHFLTRGLV